jgi:excisionase family DNA binding protein
MTGNAPAPILEPGFGTQNFLLIEEAAELLRMSVRTLHGLAQQRGVPHRRPPRGRRLLFLETEVRAWLDGAELETHELPHGGRVVKPKAVQRR